MGTKKQIQRRNNDIISASEIGQYHYCPMSWYLRRCGYEPKSPFLEGGTEKHMVIGKALDQVQSKTKLSKVIGIIGFILLIIVILAFLIGVIL